MEMFEKVVNIKKGKDAKDLKAGEQAKLFEQEEVLVPKQALDFLNNKMSNLQNTVENQNDKIEGQNQRIDKLVDVSGQLLNEIKKQTIDETRPACKISRDNTREDVIGVKSLNRHLDFYIFTGHIAEIFEMYTKDKKKFSIQNASTMLSELKIRDDINFSDLNPSGKSSKVRTYSYDVFEEILDRFKNPAKYNLNIEITSKWITKCGKLPTQQEIEAYRELIRKGL